MSGKSTYDELEQRIKLLEQEAVKHKLAEKALLESRNRYQSIFMDSPVSLWEVDISNLTQYIQGLKDSGTTHFRELLETDRDAVIQFGRLIKVLDVNKASQSLFGVGKKEDLLLPGKAFVSESWQALKDALIVICQGQIGFETETVIRDLHGDRKNVALSWSALPVQEGKPSRILISVTDITKLKKTEKALRESEERLSQIVEGNSIATIVLNKHHVVTHWNKACEYLTGIKKEEIVGTKRQWEAFYPNKRPILADLVVDGCSEKEIARYYEPDYGFFELIEDTYFAEGFFPNLGRDGKWLFFTAAPLKDHTGQLISAIETLQDFTLRKKSADALHESEKRYRTLHANVPVGLFRTDYAGKILSVNPAAAELYGYDNEADMTGVSIYDLYTEAAKRTAFSQRLRAEGKVQRFEARMNRKDGTSFWCTMSSTTVKDKAKNLIYIDGTVQDVTERMKAEEEKAKLEDQLRQAQKMEAMGTLAGGIAHDFNNILSGIFGYTQLLQMQMGEDSETAEYLDSILKAGNRAKDLVQQILTFSRQTVHELNPLRVQHVITEALKLIRSSLPSTISIHRKIQNDCGLVFADHTQIHQIVMNLCANAYHAMEKTGGKLIVNLKEVKLTVEDLKDQTLNPGPYVMLTVADNGPGMDQNVIDRIFDPYFTTKEKGKGTGLGLAVIHGIVKSHGGQISVYSEPGNGTEFHVYLPVIKSEQKTADLTPQVNILNGNECILLVDDQKEVLEIEQQMLEALGYEVIARTGSMDAIEAFRAQPDKFDLVITDMTMPNMTGDKLSVEVIKIRADIPILLCTGFSEIISREKAESLGIKGFLMKPIVMNDLSGAIRKVLDAKNNK